MKRFIHTLLVTALATGALAQPTYPTIGTVVRNDPRLDRLLPKDARIDVLASGYEWLEGPVWVKDGGYLLFSDVPQNTIFKWTARDGVTSFLKPSGYTGLPPYSKEPGSNGLAIDGAGRLIACEHGDRRVTAMPLSGGGGKVTLADGYNGSRFNSPNDVAVHSNGSYYVTDPPYGLPKGENDPARAPVFGVYRIDPDRRVTLVVRDLTRPNGVALAPGRDGTPEKTLYVAQSDPQKPVIMAYDVQPDGSLGNGRLFFDASALQKQGLKGLPDGLKVDREGNVWATGPGGVLVISPQGQLLGRIDPGEATANCAWGDDGATLYLTADMYLCRIRTTARGW